MPTRLSWGDFTTDKKVFPMQARQSSISRLENGTYNPSVGFLSKVAQAMGKQVSISFK
jgi:transcriptional regulator with XRE-family HTH domain